jgi:hypothetical protein
MLDQLFNIVKQFGRDSVVDNPEVPNEYNNDVMADATKTITNGFQNVMAGGGFQNILDLFKGGGNAAGGSGGGIGNLIKNPMVSMMIGYFISKLVGKYKMSPSSASNVANSLIPNALNGIITETNNPDNPGFTLDGLIGSLTGGGGQSQESTGGGSLQNLLEQFTGGGGASSGGGGFDLQDIIGKLTQKAQNSMQERQSSGSGGGLMDMIKGFFN